MHPIEVLLIYGPDHLLDGIGKRIERVVLRLRIE